MDNATSWTCPMIQDQRARRIDGESEFRPTAHRRDRETEGVDAYHRSIIALNGRHSRLRQQHNHESIIKQYVSQCCAVRNASRRIILRDERTVPCAFTAAAATARGSAGGHAHIVDVVRVQGSVAGWRRWSAHQGAFCGRARGLT
eukprot:6192752-Pleurochrysis_carterae.AAC.2